MSNIPTHCRYCGSEELEYLGIDDGGGDYGTSICDQYGCLKCGQITEVGCVDIDDDEYYPDFSDPAPNPNFYVDEFGGLNYYFPFQDLDSIPDESDNFNPPDQIGDIPF